MADEKLFDYEEDFDPLAFDDAEIDQEDMDDDNPYDTVDYPTMRNMPAEMQRDAVFTPEKQGSAEAAIEALFDHNPARRPILIAILEMCKEGCLSSELTEKVDELQKDNYSVYAPLTLCRMLERAGALELEEIEEAEEVENTEDGVTYLEIDETPDPTWTTTEAGLAAIESHTGGAAFHDIYERDNKYAEVYQAVMAFCDEAPRSVQAIGKLVDTFEICQEPRRFGGHFIDMLERTDCLIWKDHAWHLTELGKDMLAEISADEEA